MVYLCASGCLIHKHPVKSLVRTRLVLLQGWNWRAYAYPSLPTSEAAIYLSGIPYMMSMVDCHITLSAFSLLPSVTKCRWRCV